MDSFALEVSDHLIRNLSEHFLRQPNWIVVKLIELNKLNDVSAGIFPPLLAVQRRFVCVERSHHAEVSISYTDDHNGNWEIRELNDGIDCSVKVCDGSICENQANVIFLMILIF